MLTHCFVVLLTYCFAGSLFCCFADILICGYQLDTEGWSDNKASAVVHILALRRVGRYTNGESPINTRQKPQKQAIHLKNHHRAQLYHRTSSWLKHEKNGQRFDLRRQRGSRTVDERWAGERETRHTAEAWFFSFPSVASSKAGRSEYDNLFRGERAPPKEAFRCGNPTGA